jgi:hypothetical protein
VLIHVLLQVLLAKFEYEDELGFFVAKAISWGMTAEWPRILATCVNNVM